MKTLRRCPTLRPLSIRLLAATLLFGEAAHAAHIVPDVLTTIPVGRRPEGGIAVNSNTNRIYVANLDSNDVSVIDGATNREIDTDGNPGNGITRIPVGTRPFRLDLNSVSNRIYVPNSGSDSVSVIDGASNTVVATIPVGSGPYGLGSTPPPTASTWPTLAATQSR